MDGERIHRMGQGRSERDQAITHSIRPAWAFQVVALRKRRPGREGVYACGTGGAEADRISRICAGARLTCCACPLCSVPVGFERCTYARLASAPLGPIGHDPPAPPPVLSTREDPQGQARAGTRAASRRAWLCQGWRRDEPRQPEKKETDGNAYRTARGRSPLLKTGC